MHIKAVSNYTEQMEILYGILEYKTKVFTRNLPKLCTSLITCFLWTVWNI